MNANLTGWLKYPTGEARLSLKKGGVNEFVIGDVELTAAASGDDKIYLRELKAKTAEGELALKGMLTRDDDLTFSIEGDTKKIHFGKLLENLTVERSRADFFADMEFKLGGRILNEFKIEGDAKVEVSDFRVIEEPYNVTKDQLNIITLKNGGRVETHFIIDKMGFHWMPAYAHFGRNNVKVTGGLYFTNDDGLLLICESDENFYMEDVAHIAGFPVAGKGRVRAIIRGPYPDPSLSGDFDLSDSAFANHQLGKASGRVYFKGEQLYFPKISGRYQNTGYNGFFEIDFPDSTNIKTRVEVTDGRVADILQMLNIKDGLPEMDGKIAGKTEFSVKATKEEYNGYLKAELGEGRVAGQKFDRGDVSAVLESNRLTIKELTLSRGRGSLALAGEMDPEGKLKMSVAGRNLNASDFSIFEENKIPLKSDIDAALFIGGDYRVPHFDGRLRLENTSFASINFPSSIITVVTGDDTTYISGNINGSEATFGIKISLSGEHPFSASIKLEKLALHNYLLPGLAKSGEAKSALSGSAVLFGNHKALESVKGSIVVDEAKASLGPLNTEASRQMKMHLEAGKLYFDDVSLAGSDLTLNLSGALPYAKEEPISLSARGNMKLDWINQLGVEAFELRGDMAFDASVGGVFKDPTALGSGSVSGAVLNIPMINLTASAIAGNVVFSQNKLVLDNITGQVGDGKVRFSGHIPLINFSPSEIRISANLEKVPTDILEDLPVSLSGKVQLSGVSQEKFNLSGELTVEDAVYRKDIDFNTFLKKKNPIVFEEASEEGALDLALNVFIPQTAKIDNNLGLATLSGKLKIAGNSARPLISGMLSTNEGRFFFRQTEFELQRFELEFMPSKEIDPKLEMQAFADISDHRVFIHIFGMFSEPQIEYSSPEGLSSQDINHLIMFGITPEEAENIDDIALSQALGFEMLATIAGVDRVVRQLKLESFNVSSRYSDYSRTTEPYLNMVV
ncbi:MAG: translocation/assembly module TamB domain-containing protein, partial [Phycisphaerae bacterium]|nr:translocation/assembly module TamB domain-containing protein [Phycisphaerae bacterium]